MAQGLHVEVEAVVDRCIYPLAAHHSESLCFSSSLSSISSDSCSSDSSSVSDSISSESAWLVGSTSGSAASSCSCSTASDSSFSSLSLPLNYVTVQKVRLLAHIAIAFPMGNKLARRPEQGRSRTCRSHGSDSRALSNPKGNQVT